MDATSDSQSGGSRIGDPSPLPVADRRLIQVGCDDVPTVARKVAPVLQRAITESGGRLALAPLIASLSSGASQLWLGTADDRIEMALVTYTTRYPSGRDACQVMVMAGERPDLWLQCEPLIEAWARQRGCAWIEAYGRPGWERVLRHYRKRYVMLERELDDGHRI